MAHIKTTYTPDGIKKREPLGYGGGLCNAATLPYERRELNTKKVLTDEACQEPAISEHTGVTETQSLGH